MIRVRILRATGGGVRGVLAVGELLTLPDEQARELLNARRAEIILSDPNAPEEGAPVPKAHDPKAKRTR